MRAGLLAVVAGLLVPAAPASAAVPYKTITSIGPLPKIYIGNELSCQVVHTGDARFELFPSGVAPASCGTLLAVGPALFAPDFNDHDGSATKTLGGYVAFTPISQTDVSGAGSMADPRAITTVVDAGDSGIRITQVDRYVVGQESYRTDVTVKNLGTTPVAGVLYRAGDCYLQESDTGYGFIDLAHGAAGCSSNANNSPAGRIEQWFPITAGASYMEAGFGEIWAHIATRTTFPNWCRCGQEVDNGAGISWKLSIAPGAAATYSHYTTFSPRGIAGPPRPVVVPPPPNPNNTVTPSQAFTLPSNRRCVSRRNFRIRITRPAGVTYIAAGVDVNGRPATVLIARERYRNIERQALLRKRLSAQVALRGYPPGRFRVTIHAVTQTLHAIRGTRHYRTCAPKRSGRGSRH